MADAVGNVLNVPGHSTKTYYVPVEIMASQVGFAQRGVTLAGGAGLLAAGTVLGRVTASGKFVAYASTNTDGSQTPVGILRNEVDTGTSVAGTQQDMLGNLVYKGILNSTVLVGLDANATTSLGGRTDSVAGLFIF